MTRKWLPLIIVILFSCLIAGCKIETVEEHQKLTSEEQSIGVEQVDKSELQENIEDQKVISEPVDQSVIEENEHDEEENSKEELKSVSKEESKESSNIKLQNENKTVDNNSSETVVPKSEDNQKTDSTTPKENISTKQTEADEELTDSATPKRYVTIGIYVKSLLNNMDLLHPSLRSEQYVPSNGVILGATRYELLTENDTVWDILVRATKEHNIQMEYQGVDQNIYNSVYVEGINHLYEFSAGELSGWMYSVNGDFPNYGSSQYILKDGDVIEWHYTVDLGRDLGEYWNGDE
nr:DUF4430 domain-containing protein [Lysinibacillus timonensis]